MKKKISLSVIIMLGLLKFKSAFALADPENIGALPDWSNGNGVTGLAATIINVILAVAGTIAVLFLVVAGFQYVLSGANEDLAKRAKVTIKNAIIGLIIIILSYTIITVVYDTLTNNSL